MCLLQDFNNLNLICKRFKRSVRVVRYQLSLFRFKRSLQDKFRFISRTKGTVFPFLYFLFYLLSRYFIAASAEIAPSDTAVVT